MDVRTGATGSLVVALLVVTSLGVLPLTAAGFESAVSSPDGDVISGSIDGPTEGPLEAPTRVTPHRDDGDANGTEAGADGADRPDDPSTSGTIGYVEGYWHDDDLPIDDRDGGVVEADELEAVVYRSMARVEAIRGLTFDDEVPVEVVTRQEFEGEMAGEFEALTETDHLHHDIRFEALFMVDRDSSAIEEYQALFGTTVAGYYDPETNRIVIVSNDLEEPELDEITLGHELHHALQDQHFDLLEYVGETRDRANAYDGLIEGDATRVETEYGERCQEEWDCIAPETAQEPPGELNWGIYFTIFQPYDDGPEFVEYLESEGGWDAVDAAYDDPPTASSEIIRPEEYGEYETVEIEHEDRSSDRWQELDADAETDRSTFGEAAMAAMFAAPGLEGGERSVVDVEEFLAFGPDGQIGDIDYDQPVTDGWAGDELVKYVTEEESIEESGYVWHTAWQTEEDAEQFADGYRELLEIRGGEPVGDREETSTYVIDERFPGAYHVSLEGESVTVVRAPSVDELEEIHDGVSVSVSRESEGDDGDGGNATDEGADGAEEDANESAGDDETSSAIPGFGVAAAVAALVVVLTAAVRRGYRRD